MNVLTGLRVIELSAFVAVPLGGATLASMGADVIRVDPLGGGLDSERLPLVQGVSVYWAGLNQGKRSLVADLASPAGQELVGRLLASGGAGGGIVITNLPERGWSSFEQLGRWRPDLIMVVLSGDSSGTSAVDYTVNARLGFPMVTGPSGDRAPINNPLPAWDAQAGYLVALAVLAAERHRSRTGQGQLVRLSLMDVGLALTARLGILAEAALVAEPRARHGNFVFGTFARDLATRDGRYVMVVALTPRQWRSLVSATASAETMDRIAAAHGLDLSHDADRWTVRHEIAEVLSEWAAHRDLVDIAAAFDSAGVLWAPFRTFQQLLQEEAEVLAVNPVLAKVQHRGVGEYFLPRSSLRFGAFEPSPIQSPPHLGEHTEQVLREVVGLSDTELRELRESGTIAS